MVSCMATEPHEKIKERKKTKLKTRKNEIKQEKKTAVREKG